MDEPTRPYIFRKQPYRWVMIALLMLAAFSTNQAQFQLSVFCAQFTADFHIGAKQFSAVLLAYFVAAGVLGLAGGALADRYGVRRVFVIMACCSAAGALLRLLTSSFALFFFFTMLIGMLLGAGFAVASKVISAWFPKDQSSLAFCLFGVGNGLGVAVGQATAALYSGWRQALFVSGLIIFATALLWLFGGKNAPPGLPPQESRPALQYLGHVARVKTFWPAALSCAVFSSFVFGFSALLPNALHYTKGVASAAAGVYAALFTLGSIIGSLCIPAVNKKWGDLRALMIAFSLALAAITFSLHFLQGPWLLAMILITGLVMSGPASLLMSLPARNPAIGYQYLGSANGLAALVQYVAGTFGISVYILTPLAGADYSGTFFIAAAPPLATALLLLLIPAREVNG